MTVTDSQGNVTYVKWVKPTCSANTAESSYTLTDTGIATVYLWHLEVRIPPGHQGLTGIALVDSGNWIIPYSQNDPAWLIGDDDLLQYDYNKELGANVQFATYNTDDTNDHAWQCRLIYTPMSVLDTSGESIVVPGG